MNSAPLSAAEVRSALDSDDLTVDSRVVAGALSCSLPGLYLLVREDRCPIEPIRVGRAIRFRTADVRQLVGL